MREIYYTISCVPHIVADSIRKIEQEIYKQGNYQKYIQEKKRIYQEMNEFESNVDRVLQDPRGWKRRGDVFFVKVDKIMDTQKDYVNISISPSHMINTEYCSKIDGVLSCADMKQNKIWVCLERWLYGSDFKEVPLDEYHCYVINHEIGHAVFKKLHPECIDLKKMKYAPVMLQQSINLCNRMKFNPYPLDEELF